MGACLTDPKSQIFSSLRSLISRFSALMSRCSRLGMHVSQSLEQLEEEEADQLRVQSTGTALQHFEQVAVHILKDEINHGLLAEGLSEFDNVGVTQQLEHLYLAGGGLADSLILL